MTGKGDNQTGTQPPPLGELPWSLLPRASWTALAASLWVFYNGAPKAERAARRRRRIGGTVGYALFIFAALWSVRDVWIAALLTAPFLLGLLVLVYVFAVSRLAVFRRWRAATVWSNCDGTIIATSRRRRPGEWMVADFSAWPVGLDRAGPFLDALCVEADAAHATMTGTAGNRLRLREVLQAARVPGPGRPEAAPYTKGPSTRSTVIAADAAHLSTWTRNAAGPRGELMTKQQQSPGPGPAGV